MDLELALKIMALTALTAITVLSVFAIVSLSNITAFLKETSKVVAGFQKELLNNIAAISSDFAEIKMGLKESMSHFNSSTDEMKLTAVKFRDTSARMDERIERIDGLIKPFESLVTEVHGKVAPPVRNIANIIGAVSKSVSVFAEVISRKK